MNPDFFPGWATFWIVVYTAVIVSLRFFGVA